MEDAFHPVASQIEDVLREHGFWYERFVHGEVRTSEEAARERPEYDISQGTKALIVKAKKSGEEKSFIMVVVPGDRQFDTKKLKAETGYGDVRFASPEEVSEITHGVLPGGVPPWGNLFGLAVIADVHIFNNEKIIYNAGDRRISIAMYSHDYRKVVTPEVVDIT